jgi:hypothetical protein
MEKKQEIPEWVLNREKTQRGREAEAKRLNRLIKIDKILGLFRFEINQR